MRAPAAFAAVPLVAGCATSLLVWPSLPAETAASAIGAASLAVLAATTCAGEKDTPGACLALICGFVCAGLALGCIAAERTYHPPLLAWFYAHRISEPVVVEGTLREDASVTAHGVSLPLNIERVNGRPVTGGVRVSVTGAMAPAYAAQWRRGRRVRVPASLREPSAYSDPGVPNDRDALARRGFCLVGSVKSGALVERVEDGTRLQEASATVRAWARQRLTESIGPISERSAAIATAILIGDRSRLPQEDEKRLQRAGTYHVIAISGGNIAIVAAVLLLVARLLLVPHRLAAAFTIAALLFYAQITGPAASVERAVAAAVIFLAARVIDHRGPALNALAVAALLATTKSPVSILDPGFLLSFGATLGILVGTPRLSSPARRSRRGVAVGAFRLFLRASVAVLAATLCAELVLIPISATVFGRVTFAGLLLNLVAIPLMSVVQISAAVVLGGPQLGGAIHGGAVYATHLAASGLVESARLVEIAPWLSSLVSSPAVLLVATYYLAVACLLVPRLRACAGAIATASIGLMLAGPTACSSNAVSHSRFPLRVVVLDVGQGDATVVSMSNGRALLVDAGGIPAFAAPGEHGETTGFDVGDRVVVRALRALDVSRLTALVLTHGDPDHMLGAPAVLAAMRVTSLWEGVPVPPHPGLQALRRTAAAQGVDWRTVQAGDREQFGPVEVRVLHPPLPVWERQRIRNEDSIVLEVRLGEVSIVLAGDVGREGERTILSRLEPGRLTVLKAGHHGSATSSTPEFLSALKPAAVIFSAGRDNRFGHPHPAVVERFREHGTVIFRTDHDGAVFVETDGSTVHMRGWRGRSLVLRRQPPD
jgi:competence protein ComEC